MPLTPSQKVRLNAALAQCPSSSANPTILADMWELLPSNPQVNAAKATWKAETLAKLQSLRTNVNTPIDETEAALNNA